MAKTNELAAQSCIEALEICVHACSDYAARNIREGCLPACALTCLNCADICATTLKVIARDSVHGRDLARVCAQICRECAAECEKDAYRREHYLMCKRTCEVCAAECENHANQDQA